MEDLTKARLEEIIKKQENNTMIAHYTTMEGMLGMLNNLTINDEEISLKLWASNIFSLNDPDELMYGYSIIRKWLPKIESELCVNDNVKLSRIWSIANINQKHLQFNKLLKESLKNQEYVPYIISFSMVIDNLAMFRMYGNEASGVCLVFSYGAIKESCTLYDVCYNENLDNCHFSPYDMLKTEYKSYLKSLKGRNLNQKEKFQLMLQHLVTYIMITAPYLKRGDYEYEKEIRYSNLYKSSDSIKFRTSKNGNIIPYKEVNIPWQAVKRIIVGPQANFESSKYAIELALKAKGITYIPTIKRSNSRYRLL